MACALKDAPRASYMARKLIRAAITGSRWRSRWRDWQRRAKRGFLIRIARAFRT